MDNFNLESIKKGAPIATRDGRIYLMIGDLKIYLGTSCGISDSFSEPAKVINLNLRKIYIVLWIGK